MSCISWCGDAFVSIVKKDAQHIVAAQVPLENAGLYCQEYTDIAGCPINV